MKKDIKYYTPQIEEFHVGFEFEIYDLEKAQWDTVKQKTAFGAFDEDIDDLENGNIRVKYLDKKDIESLGFKKNGECFYLKNNIKFHNIKLQFHKNTNHISIQYYIKENKDWRTAIEFIKIKNKSELKRLMKQLQIHE